MSEKYVEGNIADEIFIKKQAEEKSFMLVWNVFMSEEMNSLFAAIQMRTIYCEKRKRSKPTRSEQKIHFVCDILHVVMRYNTIIIG